MSITWLLNPPLLCLVQAKLISPNLSGGTDAIEIKT